MKVLVACEFSGTVRNAFLDRGHDAWSCDLLPADDGSNRHIRCDARDILHDGWDLLVVAHPPCTRLCNSGISWLSRAPKGKTIEQGSSAAFSGTKARTSRPSLSDRLTPSLISSGLVCGITPSLTRKQSGQPIQVLALNMPDGVDAAKVEKGFSSSSGFSSRTALSQQEESRG